MKKSVVIIGGGLGGLFVGAILSKEGFQVTILEKNATIGGGLQSFRRFGEMFDSGMHVIGGLEPGGNVRRICDYIGITDKIDVMPVDDDCTDELYFSEDRQHYRIAKGKEGFVKSLASYFPDEEENLRRYVEAIFRVTDEVDLFYLRPAKEFVVTHSEEFLMSANDFIAKYLTNPRLRSVAAYMNPFYGGRHNQTPAYIHAIISTLYIIGSERFVGGSYQFANLLASVIEENGGQVISNSPVEWVEVTDRQVQYVRCKNKQEYRADYYISDIHPCTLLSMMPEQAFPKAFRQRLDEIPNAYSAFALYIKVRENSFPYINHSEYYMSRYDDVWNFGRLDRPWPLGFLIMTPPEPNQSAYSRKVLVTAPMNFERVRRWEDTTVGRRGDDYIQWKAEMTELLLNQIEEIHPGFRDIIEDINSSSPLTIRDFYSVKDGSLYGFSKDWKNITLSQLPVVTKVRNLLLTGQSNNLHGFCGVALTAINTCEAILGLNYIINKLQKC
jgi:all-trans-retinol 13,14-reductase